ncbi:UNVERIFIED_CONTAM: hypothetical protein GTU68_015053 [Idotea baltica]|nr:hypothetical protein [Idotea baltica]
MTDEEIFLIDCGEGTQSRMSENKIKRSKINHIFISHLHGDHCFGLPGLITSYNLYQRSETLYLYGPVGLRAFIDVILSATGTKLNYDLVIHEHDTQIQQVVVERQHVRVSTIPLEHRIPTAGYLFTEKTAPRKINGEAVARYGVPFDMMEGLRHGSHWTSKEGTTIDNAVLTTQGRPPFTFAYCSDTVYLPSLVHSIRGVDLLYHEATFAKETGTNARRWGHSTATEAALIAKEAQVGKLLIGHFSGRYADPEVLGEEARETFRNTIVAREGMVIHFSQ